MEDNEKDDKETAPPPETKHRLENSKLVTEETFVEADAENTVAEAEDDHPWSSRPDNRGGDRSKDYWHMKAEESMRMGAEWIDTSEHPEVIDQYFAEKESENMQRFREREREWLAEIKCGRDGRQGGEDYWQWPAEEMQREVVWLDPELLQQQFEEINVKSWTTNDGRDGRHS